MHLRTRLLLWLHPGYVRPGDRRGQPVISYHFHLCGGEVCFFHNYFHLATVDATSNVGTVENVFSIKVNSGPGA